MKAACTDPAQGVKPDVAIFNSMIAACAHGGEHAKARAMFDNMAEHGCAPDAVTYANLIRAYKKGGQWCARPLPPCATLSRACVQVPPCAACVYVTTCTHVTTDMMRCQLLADRTKTTQCQGGAPRTPKMLTQHALHPHHLQTLLLLPRTGARRWTRLRRCWRAGAARTRRSTPASSTFSGRPASPGRRPRRCTSSPPPCSAPIFLLRALPM